MKYIAPFGQVVSKVVAQKKEEAKATAPTTGGMGGGTFPWNKKPVEDKPVAAPVT
jgi:hypothetical protein